MTGVATGRVSPFGHPRITACVPLPLAFRSLPRPSSPPCAQASPTGLRSLDYTVRQAKHALVSRVIRIALSPPLAWRGRRNRIHGSIRDPHSLPHRLSNSVALTRSAGRTNRERDRDVTRRATTEHFRAALASVACATRYRGSGSTRRSGKEVIQPQVPLRLPCYDFAPVTTLAFGGLVPGCPRFRHRLRALAASMA
jgi:hypothetical protein